MADEWDDFKNNFRGIQRDVHKNAHDHGWWEGDNHNDGEKVALMHSELSEALEALRVGNPASEKNLLSETQLDLPFDPPQVLPLSCVEEELADVVIRIMDYAEYRGFDIAQAIVQKHNYNRGRPHKHGGKKF